LLDQALGIETTIDRNTKSEIRNPKSKLSAPSGSRLLAFIPIAFDHLRYLRIQLPSIAEQRQQTLVRQQHG